MDSDPHGSARLVRRIGQLRVDPTWDEGTEYFCVPFRHDYLRRVLRARRDYGLIDNPEMDFPLVTGAHRVDEAVVTLGQESAWAPNVVST
jgi:hypothetical protein